jgi:hypothetical protein
MVRIGLQSPRGHLPGIQKQTLTSPAALEAKIHKTYFTFKHFRKITLLKYVWQWCELAKCITDNTIFKMFNKKNTFVQVRGKK